uniref:Uncharacterized protein n=1 Tax=Panagrellus redivivus TaxID=6233 RepID=A0A7E4ULI3_PANRE
MCHLSKKLQGQKSESKLHELQYLHKPIPRLAASRICIALQIGRAFFFGLIGADALTQIRIRPPAANGCLCCFKICLQLQC